MTDQPKVLGHQSRSDTARRSPTGQSATPVLPEPSHSWRHCPFCGTRQACSRHAVEAKTYWDAVRAGATPKRRLSHRVNVRGWECASHEIETAPDYKIFVTGWLDGKRQTLSIDPDEVDELTKRLHQAKRYARSGS